MNHQCENLEECGFFINFKGNSEVAKNGWIRIFCENLERSELCERKIFKMKNRQIPPDNMAPTGTLL
jgi:hypothetical protein